MILFACNSHAMSIIVVHFLLRDKWHIVTLSLMCCCLCKVDLNIVIHFISNYQIDQKKTANTQTQEAENDAH